MTVPVFTPSVTVPVTVAVSICDPACATTVATSEVIVCPAPRLTVPAPPKLKPAGPFTSVTLALLIASGPVSATITRS